MISYSPLSSHLVYSNWPHPYLHRLVLFDYMTFSPPPSCALFHDAIKTTNYYQQRVLHAYVLLICLVDRESHYGRLLIYSWVYWSAALLANNHQQRVSVAENTNINFFPSHLIFHIKVLCHLHRTESSCCNSSRLIGRSWSVDFIFF